LQLALSLATAGATLQAAIAIVKDAIRRRRRRVHLRAQRGLRRARNWHAT
jgi:hypothetical protein